MSPQMGRPKAKFLMTVKLPSLFMPFWKLDSLDVNEILSTVQHQTLD